MRLLQSKVKADDGCRRLKESYDKKQHGKSFRGTPVTANEGSLSPIKKNHFSKKKKKKEG